jgi:hypothetical protein
MRARGGLLPAFPPAERARYGRPLGDPAPVRRWLLSAPPPPCGSTAAGILGCLDQSIVKSCVSRLENDVVRYAVARRSSRRQMIRPLWMSDS